MWWRRKSSQSESIAQPVAREIPIYVNIYNLHSSNSYLSMLGTGFYHTGVEFEGYEYSFSPNGVSRTSPQLPDFGELKEHKLFGTYVGHVNDLKQHLHTLSTTDFKPGLYNIATLNCNHFTDAFVFLLFERRIPTWINRMANIGATVLPTSATSSMSANTSGKAALPAPGMVSSPSAPVSSIRSSGATNNSESNSNNSSQSTSVLSVFGFFKSKPSSNADGTSTTTISTTNSTNTNKVDDKKSAKKQLTEKQKEALAKVRNSNTSNKEITTISSNKM
jgi:deubiquitinase DESI2